MISSFRTTIILCLCALPASALEPPPFPDELRVGVLFLGEIHDNPQHKQLMRDAMERIQPRAVVWEMLSPAEAEKVTKAFDKDGFLEALSHLDLDSFEWPNLKSYTPVFDAGYFQPHYGAHVPRSEMGQVREMGVTAYFGTEADQFGLSNPLDSEEQAMREEQQQVNHCNALPPEILPFMVSIQRLRDATLARVALRAFDETGGPVVVVTGNGHARVDWGAPVYLRSARPGVTTASMGFVEDAAAAPPFSHIVETAPIERDDPCLAFKSQAD